MFQIGSTRFNNDTYFENKNFREQNNISGCIYGIPQKICFKVACNSLIFIVEMNNTLNRIEGIGLIKNTLVIDKYYNIYNCGNYNRYILKGKYRINRDELLVINEPLIKLLDYLLFKRKKHLKRGSGITIIPDLLITCKKYIDFNIKTIIKNIFIKKFVIKKYRLIIIE
jgi:hypothetical protein